jgi:hypothetical protein
MTTNDELAEQIERLVRDHIVAIRAAAAGAVERAFAATSAAAGGPPRRTRVASASVVDRSNASAVRQGCPQVRREDGSPSGPKAPGNWRHAGMLREVISDLDLARMVPRYLAQRRAKGSTGVQAGGLVPSVTPLRYDGLRLLLAETACGILLAQIRGRHVEGSGADDHGGRGLG